MQKVLELAGQATAEAGFADWSNCCEICIV
jgi:hypothetical protein